MAHACNHQLIRKMRLGDKKKKKVKAKPGTRVQAFNSNTQEKEEEEEADLCESKASSWQTRLASDSQSSRTDNATQERLCLKKNNSKKQRFRSIGDI